MVAFIHLSWTSSAIWCNSSGSHDPPRVMWQECAVDWGEVHALVPIQRWSLLLNMDCFLYFPFCCRPILFSVTMSCYIRWLTMSMNDGWKLQSKLKFRPLCFGILILSNNLFAECFSVNNLKFKTIYLFLSFSLYTLGTLCMVVK